MGSVGQGTKRIFSHPHLLGTELEVYLVNEVGVRIGNELKDPSLMLREREGGGSEIVHQRDVFTILTDLLS